MEITVRWFARLREQTGTGSEAVTVGDGCSVDRLAEIMERRHPGISLHDGSIKAVRNRRYVSFSEVLEEGDEVSFFPPVGGG